MLLTACGFELRRVQPEMLVKSVYVSQATPSPIAEEIKKSLVKNKANLVANVRQAEAHLRINLEEREKLILSLSGAGRVKEYQLRLRVVYQVTDAQEFELVSPSTIQLTRILTFDERAPAGKEQEELFLFKDMQQDAMNQILRRLASAKPIKPA